MHTRCTISIALIENRGGGGGGGTCSLQFFLSDQDTFGRGIKVKVKVWGGGGRLMRIYIRYFSCYKCDNLGKTPSLK